MSFLARAAFAAALLAPVVAPAIAQAQTAPITGDWYGAIPTMGAPIPLIIHIKADGSAALDSPSQGAKGLPMTASLKDKDVALALTVAPARFEGVLSADGKAIAGKWLQSGNTMALTLTRDAPAPATPSKLNRPQEPKPPFPYRAEEVAYVNPASSLKLAGTLTLPPGTGPFPVALLITGSGAQDRDETIFGHKPFLLIADALTRKGVAVLRVDDRGVGGSDRGRTTDTTADYATDVAAGVAFLRARKDIDPARIGLIGHSEGGAIAPMIAARDPKIAFVVLMAAPGVDGKTLLLAQGRALETAMAMPADQIDLMEQRRTGWYDVVLTEPDDVKAKARLEAIMDQQGAPQAIRDQIRDLVRPWWRYTLAFKPADYLKSVKAPVLAIGGSRDLQVPATANLTAIKAALPAPTEATIRELPGLNHLLQTAHTGLVNEYGRTEETMSPIALDLIVAWTVAHAARK